MTEQVEAEIKQMGVQALQDLLNNLTQAKQFAVEQAPEFCQQLIARGMWLPFFTAIAAIIGCALTAAIARWSMPAFAKESRKCILEQNVASLMGTGTLNATLFVVAPLLLVAAYQNAMSALSVYVAPKVFLVEEITRMLK